MASFSSDVMMADFVDQFKIQYTSPHDVYSILQQYIVPMDELIQWSYPVPHTDFKMGLYSCVRCNKRLERDQNGYLMLNGKCQFHPGTFNTTVKGGKEIFDCCFQPVPCVESYGHVASEEDYRGLKFESFHRAKAKASDGTYRTPRFFSMDTERVTVQGEGRRGQRPFELVLVDGMTLEKELDTPVGRDPRTQVIDYCTRFHTYDQEEVDAMQEKGMPYHRLLNVLTKSDLLKQNDILIGHDLVGDLKSLKMFHFNIIDTSLLFREKYGRKLSLSQLVKEELGLEFKAHVAENDAYASLFLVIDLLKKEHGVE